MSNTIARRYAQALFDLSCETNKCDLVSQDLRKIKNLIFESDEFFSFLHNPVIPSEKRQLILENILKNKVNALTRKFIFFLNVKNRLSLMKDICQVFEQLHLDANGVLRVKITSTTTLNNKQVKEISKHLKSRFKKDIEPHLYRDPSLLGGIKIQEGGTIYDHSIRAQLEQFRKKFN